MVAYGVLESKSLLEIVNMFDSMTSVAALVGTMRFLRLSLNALTATVLSISVRFGTAYSVHITARFVNEYDDSNDALVAVRMTLTMSLGTGALAIALVLGNFGPLMEINVAYSFMTSVVALPSALFLWDRISDAEAAAVAALARRVPV